MDVYVYQRRLYCKACGERICADLRSAGSAPHNVERDDCYDDEVFPKGPYLDGGGPADVPHHCAADELCPDRMTLASGRHVGVFLENPLTQAGEEYVFDCLVTPAGALEILKLWKKHYSERLDWKLPGFVPMIARHNVLRTVAGRDPELRALVSKSVLGRDAGLKPSECVVLTGRRFGRKEQRRQQKGG